MITAIATAGARPARVMPVSNEPVWSMSLPNAFWIGDATSQPILPGQDDLGRPQGTGPAEGQLQVAIPLLRQRQLFGDPHRKVGQRLPIHGVEHRGQEQEAAHPPLPRTHGNIVSGRAHCRTIFHGVVSGFRKPRSGDEGHRLSPADDVCHDSRTVGFPPPTYQPRDHRLIGTARGRTGTQARSSRTTRCVSTPVNRWSSP